MDHDNVSLAIHAPRATLQASRGHSERHHIGWLRAAVLGASDGIVSTASLVVGVAAAQATANSILLTGVAVLVVGTMATAAGQYASVHAQADTERADLARERAERGDERPGFTITITLAARPVQAALTSAGSFALGAALPLAVCVLAPATGLIPWVFASSLAYLGMLGGIAAQAGGANVAAGARRIGCRGGLAMVISAGVGALFGSVA